MHQRQPILTALKTPTVLWSLLDQLKQQKKYLETRIQPVIEKMVMQDDGTINSNDLNKIKCYYGLAVPAVLGEAFCALRGKSMTYNERQATTCQGAMTGLFDDFFDRQQLSEVALKEFIENPLIVEGSNNSERLFLYFYNEALSNAPSQDLMLQHLYKVYDAQVESKKQAIPGLSREQIENITLKKGGASLLFYRTVFQPPMDAGESAVLYKLGGLMQLSNDIFDIYKDKQQGIYTLVTTCKKIGDLRKVFINLLDEGYASAYQMPIARRRVKTFLDLLSIGIFSRCFVCLDQLEANEVLSNGIFSPGTYNRKQLVCDMDLPLNKLRSIKYHLKYGA